MRDAYRHPVNARSEQMWGVLLAVYCACLIISNVLASKVFAIGPVTLTCGVLIFPVVYILNDMMAELFPLKQVRKGILMAFAMNLLAVACFQVAILLPSLGEEDLFAQVLGSSWRVLLASFTAYLIGSNVNAWIMNKLRTRDGDKKLFWRCMLSTVIGESLDATVFVVIAFWGILPIQVLWEMVLAQAIVKSAYEAVVFPATNVVIKRAKRHLRSGR